jgi:hypothetical protein
MRSTRISRACSQASSGRRQPCAEAVSLASSSVSGEARPDCRTTAAAISRDSGSSIARSAALAASALPAVAAARWAGGSSASSGGARPAS